MALIASSISTLTWSLTLVFIQLSRLQKENILKNGPQNGTFSFSLFICY